MKRLFALVLSLLFFFSFSSCTLNTAPQKFSNSFLDLFDTASTVTAYDKSEKAFKEHYDLFYNELQQYARLYDIYNDYDGVVNLKYINENASKAPVQADKKIMDLLLFGKEAYRISKGMVNICMGSVLSLWHGERENAAENPDDARLPDMNELKSASLHMNMDDLVLDEKNSTVYFKDSQMKIDVGAIAKGFAAERIAEYVVQNNIWQSAVISIGGNVKTIGTKENNAPFVIGIENPEKNKNSGYVEKVSVKNGESVVTSGDYQRYYTVDGVDYCHIIHPETLMPADFVSSVSVIADNSGYADMLSTALFNMSVEEGQAFVNSLKNTEAVWVDKDGKISYSSDFKSYSVQ